MLPNRPSVHPMSPTYGWLVLLWGASPAVPVTACRQGWLPAFYPPLQPVNLFWLLSSWVLPENVLGMILNVNVWLPYVNRPQTNAREAWEKANYKCSKDSRGRAEPGTLLSTRSVPRQEAFPSQGRTTAHQHPIYEAKPHGMLWSMLTVNHCNKPVKTRDLMEACL